MRTVLLTSLLLAVPWGTGLSAADDAVRFDIVYKTTDQGPLALDLHYPEVPQRGKTYPLVVFTHGGGWVTGDKTIGDRGVRYLGVKALNEAGFCVASVDYRLWKQGSSTTIRDCVIDAKDALRFLVLHAADYGVDADHVFSFGDSAGGQIAQMLLLTPPEALPGDPALAAARYRMIAGVSWYGPCDFENAELFNPDGRANFRDRFGPRILKGGESAGERLAAYREVSPVNHLKPNSPPLLMMQGDQDTTIPVHQARYMKKRADEIGAAVELRIVENSGHNWREATGALKPTLAEIVAETADFMKRQLRARLTR
ncbi:MAG: alpha/beta hydrolase [Verrucomicrobiales bacterium]|nr:alpha/beta hydrolase [Verrucomicrobiales bacterium]